MQNLMIVGNVGFVDELKTLASGTSVLNFSVATNERFTRDGVKVTETTWFSCALWGKYAETMAQFLEPRKKVSVVGKLKSDPATGNPVVFEGKNGAASKYEVTVRELELLGSKGDSNGAQEEDEIPF